MSEALKTTLVISGGIFGVVAIMVLDVVVITLICGRGIKPALLFLIVAFVELLIAVYFLIKSEEPKG